MHTITFESKKIKIAFDKTIYGWSWEKDNLKYTLKDYKDLASTVLIPATAKNFSAIMKKYSESEQYYFTDHFIVEYKKELKSNQELDIKRKMLKEKLSLDNIRKRPYLLDYSHIPEDKRYPFKHQQLELEYAVRFPAFYSLDEMGLGKTRVAIERHLFLKYNLNKINKTFVICPVSLVYNWANEIETYAPKDKAKYLVISGSKKNKLEEISMLKDKVDFFIINYEGISSIKDELLNLIDDKTNIVIDEFIKIKNPSAKRSKNLIDICNQTDYVMGLCGTPVSQGSVDLFSPNLCIDKGKKYGFSHERFINKYFWREGWKLIPKKFSYKELSELLYKNSIRFTKAQCLDIPAKRYQQILIDLPPKNQEVYDQMVNFCISELENQEVTAPIILVQLLRLSQITSGFIKTPENKIVEFKNQPKINALNDILDSNNSTQLIVWSRFVRDIKAIANLCMSKDISFGCLVGQSKDIDYKTKSDNNSPIAQLIRLLEPIPEPKNNLDNIKKAYKQKVKELHPDFNFGNDSEELKKINSLYNSVNKFHNITLPKDMVNNSYTIPSNLIGTDGYSRQAIVDKFQRGDLQVIIGTAATGGLGINLTRAERVIYYANDYSLINRLQSEDRAHRAGQKNKVLYYDLLAKDTIDVSILNVLSGKKSVADIITKDNITNFAKGKK